jgi:hypothetical protein
MDDQAHERFLGDGFLRFRSRAAPRPTRIIGIFNIPNDFIIDRRPSLT